MPGLSQEEIRTIKARTALQSAPRPTAKPDAAWMVEYMDWYFQTRTTALSESEAR